MNTLSWLIYAAEVLSKLSVVFVLISGAGFIAIIAAWFFRLVLAANLFGHDYPSERNPGGSNDYRAWQQSKRVAESWVLYFIALAALLFSAFIPSSTTVYMIAASEAGEAVVTSQDGQEMLGELRDIIRNKLRDSVGAAGEEI